MINWINHNRSPFVLIEVDPKRLLRIAENTRDFTPKKEKIEHLLERFKESKEIEAPIVGRTFLGGVSFTDGRHRATLAARLRMTAIKIAVYPEERSYIERILKS